MARNERRYPADDERGGEEAVRGREDDIARREGSLVCPDRRNHCPHDERANDERRDQPVTPTGGRILARVHANIIGHQPDEVYRERVISPHSVDDAARELEEARWAVSYQEDDHSEMNVDARRDVVSRAGAPAR